MIVFWFRRDLRLEDNIGLIEAAATGEPVLPVFIFDTNILEELPVTDSRVNFLHRQLTRLNARFRKYNSSIAVFFGDPYAVVEKIVAENRVSAVYANEDYEPYGTARDARIKKILNSRNIPFTVFKDHVLFAKREVAKPDGTPYVVFTPYSRRWLASFQANPPGTRMLNPSARFAGHSYPFLSLTDIGFLPSEIAVPDFDLSDISRYASTRNFPGEPTSRLGPHLRFGTISIREVAQVASLHSEDLLRQLVWREFFIQILWHFPHTATGNFRKEFNSVAWRQDETSFERWKSGTTGIPIVDAGMRELNATGFMHNRVRMITAGFLCKNLLIDWRWGEVYFAEKLIDYELASNVGNWQWAAGTGVDAAPYFRVLNPETQAARFDPGMTYIRKWVPERGTPHYPDPIVDLKESRQRAIDAFRGALNR